MVKKIEMIVRLKKSHGHIMYECIECIGYKTSNWPFVFDINIGQQEINY